jgi:hypothetical protein
MVIVGIIVSGSVFLGAEQGKFVSRMSVKNVETIINIAVSSKNVSVPLSVSKKRVPLRCQFYHF